MNDQKSPRHWPLAIRLEVLPGTNLIDQFGHAARYGYDAVELPGRSLSNYRTELIDCLERLPLPISSISLGYGGSLLSADPESRRQCRTDVKNLLSFCARIGAHGLIMPPVLHQDQHLRLIDSGATGNIIAAQDRLLLEQLPELADHAGIEDVMLLLEPVNKFETDYLNTIEHAFALCDRLQHPAVAITADFFHMQIEELDPTGALTAAAPWIKHVHVAENTRVEPGPGNLNFAPLLRTLKQIDYRGYIVTECRCLSGLADQVLPRSAAYLHKLIESS